MSFFDEPEETRTASRTAARRRRPTGGGRRPRPATQQAILIRRLVLAAVVVVVIILIAVLVNSCEVSARNSALKDYNNSVASLNAQSVNTGHSFFGALSGGPTSDPTALQNSLNQSLSDATRQLGRAKGLSVPDEVKGAQQNFVSAMQMRADGIRNIANQVQPALQAQTAQDAVNSIASEMARFYASDVLYKDYTVPEIIGALRAAGITVGGLGGQQINASQFLPSISWLDPQTVANQLHVSLPNTGQSNKPVSPGLHGHQLNTVSVGGTQLQTGSTNSIPASPAPTFTLNFANTGQNTETNVKCRVTISGSSITGQTSVPQTTQGESTSCQVTLNGIPPKGSHQVTAQIVPVPGETKKDNNSLTFPVDFQ